MAALGDWQDRKEIPEQAAMPLHYSGVRYTQSLKAKHTVLGAASLFGGFESWEMISPSIVEQAKLHHGG